jgi:tRNA modification GTPase
MSDHGTYAACLTPAGSGAIATIAVRGADALRIVEPLFQASGGLTPPARQFRLGKFGDEMADDVVLIVKEIEPVPWVELHCHGGRQVVQLLLDVLQRHGVRVCTWQDFERLTGDDPLRAEALIALSQASTVRTAAILLDQYHGAFTRAVQEVLATLDRGDEEGAGQSLDNLARWIPLGRHLTVPWRVVVAGEPNVGKSSLVNALAGFQRSIVSSIPGTTRDIVTVSIAIDGWPIELTDTAGLREDAGALEEQGIKLAAGAVAGADLCIWVVDGAAAPPCGVEERLASGLQLAINKTDLPPGWDWNQFPDAVRVSALGGDGLAELCRVIAQRLVPEAPPPGTAVPFTPKLCAAIAEARRLLAAGAAKSVREHLQAIPRSPSSRV